MPTSIPKKVSPLGKFLRAFVLFALLTIVGYGIWTGLEHRAGDGPRIGVLAPDFSLKNQAGQTVKLSSFQGKPVLLNFWATWCGPCQSEMPSLEALYQKYKDKNFVVLGVSLDEDGWPAIQEFLKQVPVTFPILNDNGETISELYHTFRIPESYLIDASGKISDKIVGPQDYTQPIFSEKIERLIGN